MKSILTASDLMLDRWLRHPATLEGNLSNAYIFALDMVGKRARNLGMCWLTNYSPPDSVTLNFAARPDVIAAGRTRFDARQRRIVRFQDPVMSGKILTPGKRSFMIQLAGYCFGFLGVNKIIAYVPGNRKSNLILKALGFHFIGVMKGDMSIGGEPQEVRLWDLTRDMFSMQYGGNNEDIRDDSAVGSDDNDRVEAPIRLDPAGGDAAGF
jgi:hypothetical protein